MTTFRKKWRAVMFISLFMKLLMVETLRWEQIYFWREWSFCRTLSTIHLACTCGFLGSLLPFICFLASQSLGLTLGPGPARSCFPPSTQQMHSFSSCNRCINKTLVLAKSVALVLTKSPWAARIGKVSRCHVHTGRTICTPAALTINYVSPSTSHKGLEWR